MAGRHREPDLICKFLHGDAAVGLKNRKDFAVDGVQIRHWYEIPILFTVMVFYTNNKSSVEMI